MTNDTETIAPVQKRGGWPKGKPRGPRSLTPRAEQRAPQRSPQKGHTATGRIAFSDDVYAIDRSILPEHMDYQWVTKSVMGDEGGRVRSDYVKMTMNGWEPIDASRVPQYGIASGEVNIGGLVLMQRPVEMSEEARQEDIAKATGQVSTQINRLNDIPDQLELNRPGQERRGRGERRFGRGEPIPVSGDDNYKLAE